VSEYKMWIGGKWVEAESGKLYPVFNPTTAAEIAQVPKGDKRTWTKPLPRPEQLSLSGPGNRRQNGSQTGLKIAAILRDYAKEIAEIDTLEHGTPKNLASRIAGDFTGVV